MRGHRVMLDADLAPLYGVPTRALIQAVRRNPERFPADFMFRGDNGGRRFEITNCDLKRWSWWTSLPAVCIHRTGCRHALERASKPASDPRQRRDHASVCQATKDAGLTR